jgi:hypothetical protein
VKPTRLTVDNEALYLGTKLPKELTATTARAISNNFGGAGVGGDVTYLQHGTYDTKPATLPGFKFNFQFEPGSAYQFSRAEIRVTFDSHGVNTRTPSKPAVKHFAPALICGLVSLGQVAKSVEVSPSISTPTLLVQAGIGLTMTKSTTVAREFQMKIIGEPSTNDEEAEDDDTAIWWITENAAEADGIPRSLETAVLVQYSGDVFQATVHVKVHTRMGASLFGWPWSKRIPLAISNKARFGKPAITTTFDDLEEKDWAQLTEFPGLVKVRSQIFIRQIKLTSSISTGLYVLSSIRTIHIPSELYILRNIVENASSTWSRFECRASIRSRKATDENGEIAILPTVLRRIYLMESETEMSNRSYSPWLAGGTAAGDCSRRRRKGKHSEKV